MKPRPLHLILGLVLFHYSCGQNPKLAPKGRLNVPDNAQKNAEVDSSGYIRQRIGWTNDFVHLFSIKEIASLDSLMDSYEKKTTVEFSVATIDSSMMGPIDFEPYTLLMINTWGVGKKKKNNGVLIVIAPDLRRIRIQNGYGIERVLPNQQTKTIIDETILPYFKQGKFYQGTKEGILAIMSKLEKSEF